MPLSPGRSPNNCQADHQTIARQIIKQSPGRSSKKTIARRIPLGLQLQVQPFKAVVNNTVVAILFFFFASVLSLGIVLPCGEIVMSFVM